MQIVTATADLRARVAAWKAEGLTIGFVPTMGFLHRGHLSLMELARPRCDRLVVSIFVNPLQFGEHEDLDTYPRDHEGDAAKCASIGVDLLYVPDDFYPADFSTRVLVSQVSTPLCGASRDGHFEGVTTVVARLFGVTRADLAVFGEKDYQQLAVIRRMVRDLALPVEIVGGPLIRDDDGVALSSRNAYLSPEDRVRARTLSRALRAMQEPGTVSERLDRGHALLDVDRLDYLEIRDAETLDLATDLARPARVFVAAFVGGTRLIDNLGL